MDPLTLSLLIGGGTSLLGGLFGARGQSQQAAQARSDALRRQGQIDSWMQPFLNPQQSSSAQQFQNFMNTLTGPTAFSGQQVGVNPLNAGQVDPGVFAQGTAMPSWMQTELGNANTIAPMNATSTNAMGSMNDLGMVNQYLDFNKLANPTANTGSYNRSQDALMQLINGNGGYNSITAQLDPTNGMALNDIVQGNTQFDMSSMFGALAPMEQRAQTDAMAQLNAQTGSLGRRFGTANAARSADMLTQMTEQANLRRQQLAYDSFESAQGRRLQASDLINARDSLVNQVLMADQQASVNAMGNRIQGAGVSANAAVDMAGVEQSGLNSYNSAIASLLGQAMGNSTELALGNQRTGADVSMFNAGAANTASLQNSREANTAAAANAANFLTAQNQRLQQGMAQNQFGVDTARLRSGDLDRLAGINQFNVGQSNNMAAQNAANSLSAQTTNANNAIQQWMVQNQMQQAFQAMMMGGYGNLMSDQNSAQARALQALGISAGVPIAPATAGTGMQGFGNTLGDLGSLITLLGYTRR